ncbi:MAG: toprim domain-containing protein [Chitinophagaceae bacterium]
MNCTQANKIDMVEYLHSLGYEPLKIKGHDYWYLSPVRYETEASFKVNKNKNVWYDHGIGKGGNMIDFTMEYYRCNVSEALQRLSLFHPQNIVKNLVERPPLHLQENKLQNEIVAGETAIKIIAAKQPISNLFLCRYLRQRRIDKNIANNYCHELIFTMNDKDKEFAAIGFKNNAGGYELINEYFKASNSPKYVTYFNNNTTNKITVFEGFFDFLSYQTIHHNQEQELSNFLVLNSLSFFERSVLLMEKHESIHLYLDNDKAGRKCLELAQKRSIKFKDESELYKAYKDLNEWCTKFGKTQNLKK